MDSHNGVFLSFVIPVYNAEKTMRRCLDSIVTQMDMTGEPYEVICVDDGSTDDSSRILDDYAAKHEEISVVHAANGGPSRARERGVELARGRYIVFADSDDYYRDGSLSGIVRVVKSHDGIGMYIFGYCERNELDGPLAERKAILLAEGRQSTRDFLKAYATPEHISLLNFLFNKVYRADVAKTARFDHDVTLGEDALYNYTCYAACPEVYMGGQTAYVYENYSAHSLSRGRSLGEVWTAYKTIVQGIAPVLEQYGIDTQAQSLHAVYLISVMHEYLRKPTTTPQDRQIAVGILNDGFNRALSRSAVGRIGTVDSLMLCCARRGWGRLGLSLCDMKRVRGRKTS
ncbi:glycosyltransferase family A protein [Bifidobacterium sp. SO4]|uniref:glycosyltransferase family 2 protein n=1 Tax=Bifidobacterium sp. SO4 TaxID=2809030 RepID=UPI001BDC4721|nr:glycosyltransferase family A protein [Bifidobacterium sp. SO4]MBT1169958.1 glycosyltransferase family 2 protein [Bifidobacterium sp. SO4]